MIDNILQALLNILIIVLSGGVSYLITRLVYSKLPEIYNSTGAIGEMLFRLAGLVILFVVITVILSAVLLAFI